MKIILVVIYCLLEISLAFSQGERNNWMIADSIRLNFNSGSILVSTEGAFTSQETYATISDQQGNLLFYTGFIYPSVININIFNSSNNIIPGGTISNTNYSIAQGALFLPHPGDSNLLYFFYVEIVTTGGSGKLKYSVIDKTLNNGLGAVVQSNMSASDSVGTEMLAACKHANGRDWWIIRHSQNNYSQFNILLLTPSGFAAEQYQMIPNMPPVSGIYAIESGKFSKEGDVFCLAGYFIEALFVFDFDRCTGVLSNNRELGGPNYTTTSINGYYGMELSPNGRFVYACKLTDISDTIVQFDLLAPNPKADRRKIFVAKDSLFSPQFGIGQFLLGPDDKIYFTRQNNFPYSYPYHIVQARSLSVINNPDLKDTLCNIDPYSIPIPTYHLRAGLPNLPYYALGPLTGSPCDTLTAGLDEGSPPMGTSMQAMYITNSGIINLYAQGLRGKNIKMMLYDLQGRLIKTAQGKTNGSSFAYTLKVNDLRNALYIIQLQSEKEVLSAKVVVE